MPKCVFLVCVRFCSCCSSFVYIEILASHLFQECPFLSFAYSMVCVFLPRFTLKNIENRGSKTVDGKFLGSANLRDTAARIGEFHASVHFTVVATPIAGAVDFSPLACVTDDPVSVTL